MESTKTPHRAILLAFAAIPSFDCILNQVNNVFQISIGPLSILQALRGNVLLLFFGVTAWSLLKDHSGLRRLPLPAVGSLLLLAMVISKEVITTGALSMASLSSYGQMTYWVMFWITVSVLCREADQAKIILWGLAMGATLTALSVIAGLAFGGLNYYEDDLVRSSAGWFDTSKYITGVLVCGGVTLLYLGREGKSWLQPLLAGLCFVACMITYARAGAVALGAVLVWFAIWWVVFGSHTQRRWLNRFLLLAFLAIVIAPLIVKTDSLFARWSDFQDPDKAGSGRASVWKVVVDEYVNASPAQQALGSGYSAMSNMLFLDMGNDIKHTHNDTLDLVLVAGVPGVVWLLFFIGTFAWRVFQMSLFSVEGAAGAAILLAYVLHGQFTGQLWSPDAMSYNTMSLACLSVLGRGSTIESRRRLISDPEPYSRGLATI
jgi:O-antigen ligase